MVMIVCCTADIEKAEGMVCGGPKEGVSRGVAEVVLDDG